MAKKEEKSNVIKLTEDEIKDLGNIRTNFSNITLMIGEVEINFKSLEMRKEELMASLRKLDEKQGDIKKKLEDKYGKGSISLDTGEFTPTQE
jgi:predicted RNase H-like nuclease (RuvC/YqgF family)